MVRGLALGQVGASNFRALLIKEVLVGLLNGLLWAIVVGVIAGLWFQDVPLGLVIGAAMMLNLLNAAIAGILVPLTLKRLNIDPALAGGVIVTTFTDVGGFLSFLGLGTLVLMH
jgi:magnesium transporter